MNIKLYIIIYFKLILMNLYIINPNIKLSYTLAQYLLKHFTQYNNQSCDIVEITSNKNIKHIKSDYLDKLTIGKLLIQVNNWWSTYYIDNDLDYELYYICQNRSRRFLKDYMGYMYR